MNDNPPPSPTVVRDLYKEKTSACVEIIIIEIGVKYFTLSSLGGQDNNDLSRTSPVVAEGILAAADFAFLSL